jgi:ribosomal protein S18 acetylase RimI-like enzyme
MPGRGRCAVVLPPRILEWEETLAAGLLRAAAAHALARGARLIQALTDPEGGAPFAAALEQAGFEVLALLSYMRRAVGPEDPRLGPPAGLEWEHYSRWRHRRFAQTIALTYEGSLDCPKLAGLRSIDDTLETHKSTGTFTPRTWHLASADGRPVGVALLNNLRARGELVYLGVTAAARRRGIGRTLLDQAIRDTAEMGLPQIGLAVDVANSPAVRLYEQAGFREIRRRLTYFVPAARLESLAE